MRRGVICVAHTKNLVQAFSPDLDNNTLTWEQIVPMPMAGRLARGPVSSSGGPLSSSGAQMRTSIATKTFARYPNLGSPHKLPKQLPKNTFAR